MFRTQQHCFEARIIIFSRDDMHMNQKEALMNVHFWRYELNRWHTNLTLEDCQDCVIVLRLVRRQTGEHIRRLDRYTFIWYT